VNDDLIQQTAQGWWVLKRDACFSRWVEQAQRLDHDQPVLQKLAPWLQPGMSVIDVGAGIGDHTRFYLDRVGELGTVIAFEPHPIQYVCLTRNCPQALCWPYAVGENENGAWLFMEPDMIGSSRLWLFMEPDPIGSSRLIHSLELEPSSTGSTGVLTPVKRVTIDKMELRACSFIKIDVEGCEPEVIRGAGETIASYHPAIWMEVNPAALEAQGHSSKELADLLEKIGYRVAEFYPPGSDWNGCQGGQCDILCLPK
jgi:FkbM family methyltransferase